MKFRRIISTLIILAIFIAPFAVDVRPVKAAAASPTPPTPDQSPAPQTPTTSKIPEKHLDLQNCNVSNTNLTTSDGFTLEKFEFGPDASYVEITYDWRNAGRNDIGIKKRFIAPQEVEGVTDSEIDTAIVYPENGAGAYGLRIPWITLAPLKIVRMDGDINDPSLVKGANTWIGQLNALGINFECKIFDVGGTIQGDNVAVDRGDTAGPDGAPRIIVPGSPPSQLDRPTLRFVLTKAVLTRGTARDTNSFYFTYDKSLDNGEKYQSKYKHFAVRVNMTNGSQDSTIVHVGDIDNPNDDSDGNWISRSNGDWLGLRFGWINLIIPKDQLANSLANRVYNKKVGSVDCGDAVSPEKEPKTAAPDYDNLSTLPNMSCINLNGLTIRGGRTTANDEPDYANARPIGWLRSWEVDVNVSSISNPSASDDDCGCDNRYGSSPLNNPVAFFSVWRSVQGALCSVICNLHKFAKDRFDNAVATLMAAIGVHLKTNSSP